MEILTQEEIKEVNGGSFAAIAALVAIVALPKILKDHRKEYNQWGRDTSQAYWDSNYPYDSNSNAC